MRSSDIARGAAAGAIATLAHTAVMEIARRMGVLGEPPPKKITRAVAGVEESGAALNLTTVALHFGFGAVTGALYAALHPRPESVTVGSGIRFGTLVWTSSYAGWVPALGIMPMPQNDQKKGRPPAMIAAHWAYGAVLAASLRRLRGAA
jgi:uncharacterized membrane protein YagU involved in acid resistance